MRIYPAIDIINGRCVRLEKGDYTRQTSYSMSPIDQAQEFYNLGAKFLHVVDLDGAKNPSDRQVPIIQEIVRTTALKVQVGGGIRSLQDVEVYLNGGVERVIVGSLAVSNPALVTEMIYSFGRERIVLSLDVKLRDGEYYVFTHGWQENSGVSLKKVIETYESCGTVLCTDIDKDGMLEGISLPLYRYLLKEFPKIDVIVSGGVKDKTCVSDAQQLGVHGIIIGKAIYEGKLSLKEVINAR